MISMMMMMKSWGLSQYLPSFSLSLTTSYVFTILTTSYVFNNLTNTTEWDGNGLLWTPYHGIEHYSDKSLMGKTKTKIKSKIFVK
jgi:hypothetical protein